MFRIAFIIFFRKSFWTDDAIERTGCPKRLVMIKFDDINILFAPLFEYDTIFFLNFQHYGSSDVYRKNKVIAQNGKFHRIAKNIHLKLPD